MPAGMAGANQNNLRERKDHQRDGRIDPKAEWVNIGKKIVSKWIECQQSEGDTGEYR